MMSFRLQVVLFLIMISGIIYILNLVKKKYMDLRYALIWIIVSVCILILTAFPEILNRMAKVLGIASPVNMLFFFGFCFSIVIILSLSIALSRMSEKIKRMAQEIAIMRKDMDTRLNEVEKKKDVESNNHSSSI